MYVVFPEVPASVAVVAPVVPVAEAVIGVAPSGYGSGPTFPIELVPGGVAAPISPQSMLFDALQSIKEGLVTVPPAPPPAMAKLPRPFVTCKVVLPDAVIALILLFGEQFSAIANPG